MAALIETRDLKKYFPTNIGTVHAVDGINLSIENGKTLGVVGESGCGKSTLGRTILRLLEPTSGDILFEGTSILKYSGREMKKIRSSMQVIFQDPYSSLNPRMSVFDLIAEPIRVTKIIRSRSELDDRVFSLMETVGLDERLADSFPHELDGGRRQRIGVARALSLNPKFIVCDEPVSALDVSIQAQILNLLMNLQDTMGLTYMFITHDLSVVKHISRDIMVMYLGECVEMAPSRELFKNPLHPYTRALLSAIPIPKLGQSNIQRDVIHGEVKSPIDPLPGCRFASRCKHCSAKCLEGNIPLKTIAPGHFVACRLYDE